jgi:asparagine synthase (glutamine-hydrolysing)
MLSHLVHRGPDGDGEWYSDDGQAALGHRRLAIIDPTPAGAQPMLDPSGRVIIVFNGEIYNYRELADRLRVLGARFQSSCDTEVLLQAYLMWGEDCLAELNGMFAFAILDYRRRKLFCARDRFGEKPFLFKRTGDSFAFSSEYKALLLLCSSKVEIDPRLLLRFLHNPRQGLDDRRQTLFGDIEQLLPGESASVDLDSMAVSISRYWDVSPDPLVARLSETDAISHFEELLRDSVKLRLRSDVPLGSCLSGGIDSSSIVCLARQFVGEDHPYHVFTGRFPGTPSDEGRYADSVIEATGAIPHTNAPNAENFLEEIPDFIWMNELPVGSTSQYAQWCVFRDAKEHGITVLLDGQGADELLGGYEQYFVQYLDSLPTTDPATRQSEEAAIRKRYPGALDIMGRSCLKNDAGNWARWLAAQVTGAGSNPAFGMSLDMALELERASDTHHPSGFHPLTAALYQDSFQSHLPTLLRYGDRNSMAHSIEVRLPFCDHRIAEFALSLSPANLMGRCETKHVLRRAMASSLPREITTRWNKQGFLPPQESWFAEELLPLARDIISGTAFANRGYWNVKWWRNCLKRFEKGERHLAWVLWRPVMGELWHTHFLDRIQGHRPIPIFTD